MKLTRRQLAAAIAAAPLAPVSQGQPAGQADDPDAAARSRLKSNAEALAAVPLPMATEPAFQFKA